jgi:probable F420-dependent oxidoreductase
MTARERLGGTTGVWYFTDAMSAGEAAGFAQRVESLGYSALWMPDTIGRDPFAHIAWLGSQTSTLVFATGIASIFHRHPGPMAQVTNTLAEQTGGRFVLGLGVSHAPMVEGLRKLDYSKPLTTMREYLAAMDASPYRGPKPPAPAPRLLAALGPKMLELSRDAADGAHPYWTTPEHTAQAREILGAGKLLCVEQKVVVTTDADAARTAGRVRDRRVRRPPELPEQLAAPRIHR